MNDNWNFDNGHHSPRQGLVERNTGIKPPSFRFHSPVQNNFYDQQDSVSVWRQKRDEYMVAIRNAKNARELGYKRNLLPQNNTVMDFNSQGGEPENEADDDSGFHKYVTRNMVQRKYSGDDEPRNTTLDDSSSMYPHQATSSNLLLNNTSRVNMLQPSASAGTNSYDIQSLQAQLNAMNLELQRRMMLEYEFAIRSLNIQIQAIQNYNSWLEFMQQVNNYKALASRPDNLHEIYEETDTTEIHGDPQATSQLPTLNEKNPPVLPHDGKIEVDTYQVAVDNGDCSIHLLVLRPTSGRRYGPRGTILRAILMDGGNSSTVSGVDASTSIRATIEDIEDLYYQQNLFNGLDEPLGHHNRLKFHTWIVTHWDADHWMGAMQLLVSEMAAYDKKQSAYLWYETDHSHKISAQKKYGHEVKYPFSMTNPTLEKRPRSVLYCPTWCWAPKPAPSNFTGGPTDATKTSGTFSAGLLRPKEMIDSLKLEFLECPNSIKVCYGPDELIGRDFWTNQKVPSPVNNIKHISQVEQALSRNSLQSLDPNFRNRPKFETWPIFFCFGAAGTVIGDATKPLPTKTEGEETPANRSSIMSLLYWPAMNGTPESISMYWSGDAVKSIETTFAKKVTSFLGNRRVGILKLSHHGSQHSTPMELLDALKPCRFIVSAGSHRKYEHPHRDTLKRVQEYLQNYDTIVHPKESCMLYATRFPAWFDGKKQGIKIDPGDHELWNKLAPIRAHADREAAQNWGDQIVTDYLLRTKDEAGKIHFEDHHVGVGTGEPLVHVQYILIQSTQEWGSFANVQLIAVEKEMTFEDKIANGLLRQRMKTTAEKAPRVFWGNEDEKMILYAKAVAIIQQTVQPPPQRISAVDLEEDDED